MMTMIQTPIVEIDVHGLTVEQAITKIEAQIRKAGTGTYRIQVIHGYNRGNRIQEGIYREIGYGLNPKVLRIAGGDNPGITELILKEY